MPHLATHRRLRGDQGQATIAALILIPVALAIFAASSIIAYALALEARATAACRASVMNSQTSAARSLENLLRLNPSAERVEIARKAAEAALEFALASNYPPSIVAAEAQLVMARAAQAVVMAQQQFWLARGRAASASASTLAAEAARESVPDVFSRKDLLDLGFPSMTRARFHVIATPDDAQTPTYRTAPNFEKSQIASVRWPLNLKTVKFETRVDLGCSASLKNEGNDKWSAQITEDKLLQN